ncbi:hypothetical protein F2Q70_00003737 [Brassica cretica]|uniref:Uncharacterized protein n=1 Tax=Brassica cretica TaxID=69181 RepID=A0A8S9IPT3_BRACR|nr:hypothetical protein F2Q70_00003737 [Brassica cretica]
MDKGVCLELTTPRKLEKSGQRDSSANVQVRLNQVVPSRQGARRSRRDPGILLGKAHAPTWFQHDPSLWTVEESMSYRNFDRKSSGTDHTGRLIHQYVHRDTQLRSDGPKGKDYGLSRVLLDQSEFWLDHQSWLGEWCGEDGLRFDRLDMVPALAPFRTYAGRSGTRLGQLREPRSE